MLSSIFALVVVPACLTAKGNAHAVLDRAASVVGLNTVSARILRLDGSDIVSQDYQSDRTNYPPYLSDVQPLQLWYSAASRVERRSSASSMAGFKFGGAVMIWVGALYVRRSRLDADAERGSPHDDAFAAPAQCLGRDR
jgi:hypothetical protein